ncbi:MAG: endonuclease mitochondrial [Sphingomonadales bacterium]|jgi:endonuclease G|nr:endonuclease mitochondrial [Sphingomonadales bacterium]
MARGSKKSPRGEAKLIAALREHVRAKANEYLKDSNITSVGIGLKNGDGPISLQFTVGRKASGLELEALDTEALPESITLPDGTMVPTDVIERSYRKSFELVQPETVNERRQRRDPIQPGISISHPSGTAGTIGLIVYDRATGAPCVLSNWHVLHGNRGAVGDAIVQPGPADNNNSAGNGAGNLLRSHLGNAGDCALARIEGRRFERAVFELAVTPRRMARVALGDSVVKSGRTTGVTYGIVRRVDVVAKIDYGQPTGEQPIGAFEIGIDPRRRPGDGEVSKGGDSGSAWLVTRNGRATDIFAGLHFAGEASTSSDEHALACYPSSVQKKLDFVLEPPRNAAVLAGAGPESGVVRAGYDAGFLRMPVPLPRLTAPVERDTFRFAGGLFIPYTHFSVALSKGRRIARVVAWNIDGARIVRTARDDFQLDPRIPANRQLGEDVYAGNKLDRGHIARRADLVWGPLDEARQANTDSSYFPNIAPQHERYNQSSRKGLWGELENLIFEQVDVQDVRMSVFGGPIFGEDDISYRGARIPREYWKLIAYVEDGALRAAGFVLSQANLLSDLEAIDLDPFRLYQVRLADLEARTGLAFDGLGVADTFAAPERAVVPPEAEGLGGGGAGVREVTSIRDLRL